MNEKEAVSLVAMLMAAYPRVEVPKATIGVYQKLLSDLDLCAAKCAITRHIASSQYFPSIAEIRGAALAFSRPRVPSPGEAWAEVMNLLPSVGSYGTPNFSHGAIKKAVKAIGWRNLWYSESINVERAHFLKIYGSFQDREQEDANITPLLDKLGLTAQELPSLTGGRGKQKDR